jgi:myosin heavy subunit
VTLQRCICRYDELIGTMHVLGFSADEISEMRRILAAILLSGNLRFREAEGSTDDSAELVNPAVGRQLATLLAVAPAAALDALTTRHIVTAGEVFHKPLNAEQAADARDTFAQNTYDNLFSWIARRLNTIMGGTVANETSSRGTDGCCDAPEAAAEGPWAALTVGVLDIFGFENFERNGFEQLCRLTDLFGIVQAVAVVTCGSRSFPVVRACPRVCTPAHVCDVFGLRFSLLVRRTCTAAVRLASRTM